MSDTEMKTPSPEAARLMCQVCGAAMQAEDVRWDLALARCSSCQAVYDLSGRKGQALPASRRPQAGTRAKAALPSRFQVEELGSSTQITWRWFNPIKHIIMAFFCVLWDGFLVTWYSFAFFEEGPPQALLLCFPLLHVAAGIGLTYSTLCGFFNRTLLEVSRDSLTIRHGPLPWTGNRTLTRRELTQLYGLEVVHTSKGRRTGSSYNLCALDREGRKVVLLSGLEEKEQVLWLEQALERRLGIEDTPVEGEVAARSGATG